MNMQQKRVLTVVVGLLMAGLATWKGPTVAGVVAGALTAICVLVGTLHVLPAKYEGALVVIEDAVDKKPAETIHVAESVTEEKEQPK